jgi:hypothetical protein
MHDALTDLHAYALILEADWQRLAEPAPQHARSGGAPVESVELAQRRAEMTEELQALRATTVALREAADPTLAEG